jgi:3-methyladenine DNA glycosylase AlkD
VNESAGFRDDEVLDLAARLWRLREHRFLFAATTVLCRHPTALRKVRWKVLEPLGNQMDSWGAVDQFAMLAGPAWREGRISDARVLRWTRSRNRWWRRAALVCTVFLNRRSQGGEGDTTRTLMVCEPLAADRDDMVAKAMSWALRDLAAHDPRAVGRFLLRHDGRLPALVKREVRNKLTTGVKNPRRPRRRRAGL